MKKLTDKQIRHAKGLMTHAVKKRQSREDHIRRTAITEANIKTHKAKVKQADMAAAVAMAKKDLKGKRKNVQKDNKVSKKAV